jgi:PTS system mannose-specific IIB component
MKNIVLARIDDRLIHGQITIGWLKKIKVDSIVIIDEELRKNKFLKSITKKAAPKELKTEVFSVEEFIDYYNNDVEEDILVLVKQPGILIEIQNRQKIFTEINLGNLGSKDGSSKIYKNINMTSKEKNSIKNLIKSGCSVFIQMLPEDNRVNIEKII